jgi:hypothetical protein
MALIFNKRSHFVNHLKALFWQILLPKSMETMYTTRVFNDRGLFLWGPDKLLPNWNDSAQCR